MLLSKAVTNTLFQSQRAKIRQFLASDVSKMQEFSQVTTRHRRHLHRGLLRQEVFERCSSLTISFGRSSRTSALRRRKITDAVAARNSIVREHPDASTP